jgi:limonene-1,2-epoxide hydrolase
VGTQDERAVRDFIKEWECSGSWDEAQIERMLKCMTPDARYHVFAWDEPFEGHAEIRNELRRQAPRFSDVRIEILNVASSNQTVFVERVDWITKHGNRVGIHVVGVFELDPAGNVATWRDYSDSREIAIKYGRARDGTS